jgi:hypothetical protein
MNDVHTYHHQIKSRLGLFTYTCERPNIIKIALIGLPGGGKCRKKKTLSDLTRPLHVVDELLKKCSSSSPHYSPLLDIGLSDCSPCRSIFSYSHPAPARCPAQIVTPPGLYVPIKKERKKEKHLLANHTYNNKK